MRTTRAAWRRDLDAWLVRTPLQARLGKRALGPAVLAYHGIPDRRAFEAQMEILARAYHPVAPSDVALALQDRAPLPPRSVLITFDDAGPSLLHNALPVLRERGLSALAFAVPGLVGTDLPFWWREAEALHLLGSRTSVLPGVRSPAQLVRRLKQLPDEVRLKALRQLRSCATRPPPAQPHLRPEDLKTLHEGGIEIGSHSMTHPIFTRCSEEKVRKEVFESHERLATILGRPPRFFAYPNGDATPEAEETLRSLGYRAAFLFDHRRPAWPPREPLRISRLRVGSETSRGRFELILSGLHPAMHRLLGRR